MRRVRFLAICVGIACACVAVGCGSSGSTTTTAARSGTTGANEAGTGTTGGPGISRPGGSSAEITYGGQRAIHTPVQSRGIKGENPVTEAATKARISVGDCAALGRLAERQAGAKLTRRSTPKPPLSRCRLSGHGASIDVFLDTGFAANQRYHNRITETVQFGYESPAKVPHPVPHVGEKAAYNSDASWIPALRSLLAVRGNRWLTVTISVAGKSNRELRDEAAVLALAGFRSSAR